MTQEQLDAIRARCDAATPGPWFWRDDALWTDGGNNEDTDWDWSNEPPKRGITRLIETDSGYYPPRDTDREFIAHARTDVAELLAEIERLRAAANG